VETRLPPSRKKPRIADDERVALLVPLRARYVDQTDTAYIVGEPSGMRTAHVQKLRDASEPYPPRGARGVGLLRLSSLALAGAICGGIGGVLLGLVTTLVALERLASLSSRVRRRQRSQQHGRQGSLQSAALPEAATTERLRLIAALGQGVLAVLLGALVLALLRGLV
jgi:hypothetical protein